MTKFSGAYDSFFPIDLETLAVVFGSTYLFVLVDSQLVSGACCAATG